MEGAGTASEAHPQVQAGLEGVVASVSSISFVDGTEGRLLYRGYDIHDLAEHSTFEEVVHLLWHGELPTKDQLEALQSARRGRADDATRARHRREEPRA